jgi:hypothetical protein
MQSQDSDALTEALEKRIEECRAALLSDATEAHATQYVTLETLLRSVIFQQEQALDLLVALRDEVRALRDEPESPAQGGEPAPRPEGTE